MRERVVINNPSGYSVSGSGGVDASGVTAVGTFYANVTKGSARQDIEVSQNLIENVYTFEIRNDRINTFTKQNTITWDGKQFSIIDISQQRGKQLFIEIIAVNTE